MMVCEAPVLRGPNKGSSATGTKTGYSRHRRAGERPCEPCQDASNAQAKTWRIDNAERVAELHRRWAKKHSGKIREASRQYAHANPTKRNENTRLYRARKRATLVIPFTQDQLTAKLAYWGNRCHLRLHCDGDAFEGIDHVIPLAQGGSHVLANLRPACRRCNSAKRDRTIL